MTPPIQEPSAARDQSGLAWSVRQLARRPAVPTTAGDTPHFWIASNGTLNYDDSGTWSLNNAWKTAGDSLSSDYFAKDNSTGVITILQPGIYFFHPNLDASVVYPIGTGFELLVRVKDFGNLDVDSCWSSNPYPNLFGASNTAYWAGVWRIYAGPSGGSDTEDIDMISAYPLAPVILSLETQLNSNTEYPVHLIWELLISINKSGNLVSDGDLNAPKVHASLAMFRIAEPVD